VVRNTPGIPSFLPKCNAGRYPSAAEICDDFTETACAYDTNLDDIGWYCYNSNVSYSGCWNLSGSGGSSCAGTHPVGGKESNAWGLFDMHGSLWEWCRDWYNAYPADPLIVDLEGPVSGTKNVMRSGSWGGSTVSCRSANRFSLLSDEISTDVGFRFIRQP